MRFSLLLFRAPTTVHTAQRRLLTTSTTTPTIRLPNRLALRRPATAPCAPTRLFTHTTSDSLSQLHHHTSSATTTTTPTLTTTLTISSRGTRTIPTQSLPTFTRATPPTLSSPTSFHYPSSFSSSLRRSFHSSSVLSHGAPKDPNAETVKVVFLNNDDSVLKEVDAVVGDNILEVAHANDVDLEGACECSLACSTCHVILEDEAFDALEEPSDEENDMLDLAFGLTETSRLGCQIIVTKEIEGIRCKLPSATRNFAVDGFKPKPH
eukprot:TRINITY_DN3530_c0_g1_i2.p1 TRINITY_DN3530_c0_g1~~TRINITY_DN3530_c0_g1_i2.p1  ORF type:complete len:265 (+),score=39.04 TRINITY_DN3530_c0_g1_i2:154-948(+)